MLERRTTDWKLLNIRSSSGKRSAPCPDSDEEGGEGEVMRGASTAMAAPLRTPIEPRSTITTTTTTEEGASSLQASSSPKLAAVAEEETFSDLEATLLDELDHS